MWKSCPRCNKRYEKSKQRSKKSWAGRKYCSVSCRIGEPETRFWDRVRKTATCWLWVGDLSTGGYGVLSVNGKKKTASRYSWVFHKGKIPNGLSVCHRCDVRACVNPAHLFLGTQLDNVKDMVRKGRRGVIVGEMLRQSNLTREDVITIRKRKCEEMITNKQLSEDHGVGITAIRDIIARKTWVHL